MILQSIQRELVLTMPGLALAPLSYHLCTMGHLAMTSPLIRDLHSYLPVSMIISTSKKATSMCSYFQGGPHLSPVALLTTGHVATTFPKLALGMSVQNPLQPQACALVFRDQFRDLILVNPPPTHPSRSLSFISGHFSTSISSCLCS